MAELGEELILHLADALGFLASGALAFEQFLTLVIGDTNRFDLLANLVLTLPRANGRLHRA